MHQGFDLEVKWRHVGKEARLRDVVGISVRLCTVDDRTVEEASDGPDGL